MAAYKKAQARYLSRLRKAAGKSEERQAFVGRELARHVELEILLKTLMKEGCPLRSDPTKTSKAPFRIVKAGAAVVDSLDAQAHAQNVLQYLIYPKMMRYTQPGFFTRASKSRNSPRYEALKQADDKLRAARTPNAVNDAIQRVIEVYGRKTNGKPRDSKFAARCQSYLMKAPS
jgi:hypothetical protein